MMLAEGKFHIQRLKGARPAKSDSSTCAEIRVEANYYVEGDPVMLPRGRGVTIY